MESPVKTPNISEMMSRFARSCKLRSMEFLAELNDFPDGYPNAQNLPYQEIPTENGSENQKIVEDNPVLLFDGDSNSARAADDNSLEVMISNLFANISAFKAAYVQLQTAHTPFDVNNIQTADRAVIAQLQKLSDLKKCYRNGYKTLLPDTQLEAQVHERQCMLRTYEMMLNRLESDIQSKDTEVDLIKEEIKKVNAINFKLEKKLREESDLCLSIELFVRTVQEASRECHGFSKLLIGLMKDAKWDLDSAAHSIQPDIRLECFSEFQDLKEQDPLKFLESYSPKGDCMFEKFCHKKYMQVVHPKMEKSFFGDLGQRDCVENGGHPDSAFYQTFLKLAKSVWLVHRLAFSFDPTVNIFQVRRGTLFSAVYMESVVQGVVFGIEGVDDRRPKVGFTVMPGFRVGKTVIQCQVYLIDTECID
ncbi:protein GRAVITROPIC IN THE LIGHT 1 [Cryptomeria japonica]|uniref:protein GRAVITROPIC IN THE LIGHT 1 n=1 Tax=Cryptomeria japonica TaxID=3369 RepID=UPI0027DA5552|nr:protein GRAVITROPIC IN THE LIGHT 1 [Cryptomeria japonica]